MRTLLVLWLTPFALFWTWHFAAIGGFVSRDFHDEVFALYAQLLGIETREIPVLFAKALLLDGLVVLAVVAFRQRRTIAAFVRSRRQTKTA